MHHVIVVLGVWDPSCSLSWFMVEYFDEVIVCSVHFCVESCRLLYILALSSKW